MRDRNIKAGSPVFTEVPRFVSPWETIFGMSPRPAAVGLVFILLAALATACGKDPLQRAAVAAAKCYLPVAEKLHIPETMDMQISDVRVTALGHGRYRVTGMAKAPGRTMTSYTCELAPDSSDKLRGFRVTTLVLNAKR